MVYLQMSTEKTRATEIVLTLLLLFRCAKEETNLDLFIFKKKTKKEKEKKGKNDNNKKR